jgi:DNA-binding MarR family transcriptional regulator
MISYKEIEPSIQLSEITSQLFANCFEKETRHAAKFGLSIVESRCLRMIFDHPHLPVKDLAKYMVLSSSRITRIIDGMVDKKLVKRRI